MRATLIAFCRYDLYATDVSSKAKELAEEQPDYLDDAEMPYFYPSWQRDGYNLYTILVRLRGCKSWQHGATAQRPGPAQNFCHSRSAGRCACLPDTFRSDLEFSAL